MGALLVDIYIRHVCIYQYRIQDFQKEVSGFTRSLAQSQLKCKKRSQSSILKQSKSDSFSSNTANLTHCACITCKTRSLTTKTGSGTSIVKFQLHCILHYNYRSFPQTGFQSKPQKPLQTCYRIQCFNSLRTFSLLILLQGEKATKR